MFAFDTVESRKGYSDLYQFGDGTGYQYDGASSCSAFGNGCCVETATNRIELYNAEPYPDWTQRRIEVAVALGPTLGISLVLAGFSSAKGCNELL